MHRRAVVTFILLASLGIIFVQGAWAWTTDRWRTQATAARESSLYAQLANRDGVLESQRRIYMERFRRLEEQLRERDQDVAVLRSRLRPITDLDPATARAGAE